MMDIMLRSYSQNDIDCQLGEKEVEGDFEPKDYRELITRIVKILDHYLTLTAEKSMRLLQRLRG